MNDTILYDVTLEFKTEFFVSVLGEEFEKMMVTLTRQKSGIGSLYTMTHNMSITDTPVIPDDEIIEGMRQTIFEEVSKAFSEKKDIEVRGTKFIGITSVKRKGGETDA